VVSGCFLGDIFSQVQVSGFRWGRCSDGLTFSWVQRSAGVKTQLGLELGSPLGVMGRFDSTVYIAVQFIRWVSNFPF
jgi:hypothetical protein